MTGEWATSDKPVQGDGLAPELQGVGGMTGEEVCIVKSFKCEMTHPCSSWFPGNISGLLFFLSKEERLDLCAQNL